MAARKIGGISVAIVADTSKFVRGVSSAQKLLGTFGRYAKMAGVAAAGSLAAGLVKATYQNEQLNRSMTRSLAIMGDVSKAMRGEMRQAAIDVAKTTNFSASQAADAYYYLASAGLDAQQSLAAMPKVAKFATAGNFDLALATDLLTDAQSALGLTVKDSSENMQNMTRVSDVLVKANTLANASVEQFSKALTTKAGAALRMLGKDVEEGVAVLAAYADQGLKAEEAGTAFSIVLRDMQTKALQNAEAFKKNRIAVFDSAGEMRNMADIIKDVENRLWGMSDAQKKATLLSLGFSDKSVAYTQSLIGTSEKIRDYEKALRAAGGTTADVAEKSLTPMEKSLNKLKGAFQQLAEAMTPVVDKLAEIASSIADIADGSTRFPKWLRFLFQTPQEFMSQPTAVKPRNKDGLPGAAVDFANMSPREWDHYWREQPGSAQYRRHRRKYPAWDATKEIFGGNFIKGAELLAGKPPQPTLLARAKGAGYDALGRFGDMVGMAQNLAGRVSEASADAKRKKDEQFRPFKYVGEAIANKISAGLNLGRSGIFEAQKAIAMAPLMASKLGGFNVPQPPAGTRPALAFAESGSADSYRQQAAIRRQGEGQQLDKKRNTLLEKILMAQQGNAAPRIARIPG